MSTNNGEKSRLIYFLLALLQTIILAWSWKTDASMVDAKTNIATLQADYSNIASDLKEIKKDIRTILRSHQ